MLPNSLLFTKRFSKAENLYTVSEINRKNNSDSGGSDSGTGIGTGWIGNFSQILHPFNVYRVRVVEVSETGVGIGSSVPILCRCA